MSKLGYVTGGYTPLMMAAEEGNLSRVRQFLPKSNVNQKNDSGYSALALAVKSGKIEVVQELIKHNSDVNSRNNVNPM
jgi:ankyrin repeat protein